MRDLLASALIMAALIGTWLVFDGYSQDELAGFSAVISAEIIPAVEEESWDESLALVRALDSRWHDYRRRALFFLETAEINEIDFALAKTEKYMQARDVSNSSGELNSLAEQLDYMQEKQHICAANIF